MYTKKANAGVSDTTGLTIKANPLNTAAQIRYFSWETLFQKNITDKSMKKVNIISISPVRLVWGT